MSSARKIWHVVLSLVLIFPYLLLGVFGIRLPMWAFGIAFALALVVVIVGIRRKILARRQEAEAVRAASVGKVACPSCGYWIGREQQQCPECGKECPEVSDNYPAQQECSPMAKKAMGCIIILAMVVALLQLWSVMRSSP